MAMTKEQKDKAHEILRRFKTKDLPPYDFSWYYIAEQVGVDTSTLYRNKEIKEHCAQVRATVRQHKAEAKARGLSKKRSKNHKTEALKRKNAELKAELARVREMRIALEAFIDKHQLTRDIERSHPTDCPSKCGDNNGND